MASQRPKKSPFQPVPPRTNAATQKNPTASRTQPNTHPNNNTLASAQIHSSRNPSGTMEDRNNTWTNPAGSLMSNGQSNPFTTPPSNNRQPSTKDGRTNASAGSGVKRTISFRSTPVSALKRPSNAEIDVSLTTTDISAAFPAVMVPAQADVERAHRMTTPQDFKGMCEDLRTFMNMSVSKVPHQLVKLFRTTLMLMNRYSVDDSRDFAFNCNQLFVAHFDKKRNRGGPAGATAPISDVSNGRPIPKRTRRSNDVENSRSEIEKNVDRAVSRTENDALVKAVSAMVQESNPAWAPRGASPEREFGGEDRQQPETAAFDLRARLHKRNEVTINTKMSSSTCPWNEIPIDEKDRYVLWDVNESEVVAAARLKRAVARKLETMLDIHQQLHLSQARLLRYLWVFLTADPVRGTVLCGAMGALRIHQVFAFASIYMEEKTKIVMKNTGFPPRILVVVPKDSEAEWAEHISSFNMIHAVVIPNKTSRTSMETLDDWKRDGGVLVCAETFYYTSLKKKTDKGQLCRELLCNPGPNVIFLDQASRFPILKHQVKNLLFRTKTKARVALTGVSIGGNVGTMWHVLNWVYPGLVGDVGEYRAVYENRIVAGHRFQSELPPGNEAYRAASSLFGFVHPVIFPSFGLYDFDKYSSRCVKIDSLTVNTNMYPYQHNIYVHLQRYFWKLVSKGRMSAFVAAHILMVAGTSIHALSKLLEQGAQFRHRCVASKRLEKPLEELEQLFQHLHRKINENNYYGNGHRVKGSPKFVIARHLFKQCVEKKEKMVVFTSSQEVLLELKDYLTATDRKDGHVACWNPAETYALRVRNVKEFRDFRAAAVLVAPYGPTIECRESMGWADLKVSKVVIMDSGWHAVAEAQCVKRIESRLSGNTGRRVQVINLVAFGTLESRQYSNVLQIFRDELIRLRNTKNLNPQCSEAKKRSYLMQSEIDRNSFGYEPGRLEEVKDGRIDVDSVTREVEEYCKANTTIDLRKMLQLKIGGEWKVVRGITAKHNRVLAVACFAEMCTRAPLHETEGRKAREELMNGFRRYARYEEELAKAMSGYRGMTKVRDDMVRLMNPEKGNNEGGVEGFEGLEPHELMMANWLPALWEPYYDLYERHGDPAMSQHQRR